MKTRIEWIDIVKGLGITFIIIGHNDADNLHLYSFHVPLFFAISGYLFSRDRYSSYVQFLRRKAFTILIPYIFFYLYSFTKMVIALSIEMQMSISSILAMDNYRPYIIDKLLLGMLSAKSATFNEFENTSLWFLPCMFVAENIFYIMHAAVGRSQILLGVLLIALSLVAYGESLFIKENLPWSADRALTAVVFLGAGYIMKELVNGKLVSFPDTRLTAGMALGCLLASSVLFSSFNGRVDMNGNQYGNYAYFYISAISGILFYMILAQQLGHNRFLASVGQNTIILLGLNQSLSNGVAWALRRIIETLLPTTLLTVDTIDESTAWILVVTCLTIIVSFPIMHFISAFAPFLIGRDTSAGRVALGEAGNLSRG